MLTYDKVKEIFKTVKFTSIAKMEEYFTILHNFQTEIVSCQWDDVSVLFKRHHKEENIEFCVSIDPYHNRLAVYFYNEEENAMYFRFTFSFISEE